DLERGDEALLGDGARRVGDGDRDDQPLEPVERGHPPGAERYLVEQSPLASSSRNALPDWFGGRSAASKIAIVGGLWLSKRVIAAGRPPLRSIRWDHE